jgi:20S proteasome subunit beta 5
MFRLRLVNGFQYTLDVLLNVRPFAGLRTLSNGLVGRFFAKFEIEVPLFVTGWSPKQKDPRFSSFPALLEKDPYHAASVVSTVNHDEVRNKSSTVRKLVPLEPPLANSQVIARAYHSLPLHRGTSRSFSTAPTIPCRLPGRAASFYPSLHKYSTRKMAIGTLLLSWFVTSVSGNYGSMAFDSNRHGRGHRNYSPPLQFAHGTTTLSFVFQGGIVAAVDSRASIGNFVGSKTTEKVLPINTHLLSTMAGGAADCTYWIGAIRSEAEIHELLHGRRISVAHASRMLSDALYRNRNAGLSIGTMVMGFDHYSSVPSIYYVDSSGVCLKGAVFAVGSGASHALGVLDKEFRHGMTTDEAIRLGIKAIRFATYRDASSGGFINVYVITEEGWRRVYRGDVAAIAAQDQISLESHHDAIGSNVATLAPAV